MQVLPICSLLLNQSKLASSPLFLFKFLVLPFLGVYVLIFQGTHMPLNRFMIGHTEVNVLASTSLKMAKPQSRGLIITLF
jgi:hypothetical protein